MTNLSILANTGRYGSFKEIGGLAAYNLGLIDDVHISGSMSVSGAYESPVGLLVGSNGGTIRDASAQGLITITGSNANNGVGGLVGGTDYYYGAIDHCRASVNIQDNENGSSVGGLAGGGGGISNSFADGNVSGGATGGLVGTLEGLVIGSFATGSVHGQGVAGGLVGFSNRGDPDTKIVNSYSTGSATASADVGGLIGYKETYLQQVYSIGETSGGQNTGGSVGYDSSYGAITAAYWDLDTNGVSNPAQGAGNIPNDPGITGLSMRN